MLRKNFILKPVDNTEENPGQRDTNLYSDAVFVEVRVGDSPPFKGEGFYDTKQKNWLVFGSVCPEGARYESSSVTWYKEIEVPGATGLAPEGKIRPNDEGEIAIKISREGSKIVMDFGKQLSWVGMTPEQAIIFSKALVTFSTKK